MKEAGDGNPFKNAISEFGAVIGLSIENAKVFEDQVFSIAKRLAIPSSGTVELVIDPTACTCEFLVFLPAAFKAFGAGPIEIDMFFGTDADEDGTLIGSINRDNTSSTAAMVKVRQDPTINDDGTKLPVEFTILSNGVAAVTRIGGESKDDFVFNARQDGKYMFRLTNTEATAAAGHVSFNWFEVPTP